MTSVEEVSKEFLHQIFPQNVLGNLADKSKAKLTRYIESFFYVCKNCNSEVPSTRNFPKKYFVKYFPVKTTCQDLIQITK